MSAPHDLVPFAGGPPGPVLPARRPGYTWAAFVNRVNLLALASAAGVSAAVGSALPAVLAVGAELVYLGTVPGLRRFRRLVDSRWHHQRRQAARADDQRIYQGLSPNQRAIYDGLRELRVRLEENYLRLGGGTQVLTAQSLALIDQLLGSFLRLLDHLNASRRLLSSDDLGRLRVEIAELRHELAQGQSPRLTEIKQRRLDILTRRLERSGRSDENREIVSHQLAAIEDLLRLVYEQSLTLRDPQDVSRQLDALAAEVEETEGTVREMESFLRMQEELDETLARPVS